MCEGAFCGAHGYLHATHSGCFLGEAATGRDVRLRLGLYAYPEPLNDWRVRYAASYALVYGPLVMVALTLAWAERPFAGRGMSCATGTRS